MQNFIMDKYKGQPDEIEKLTNDFEAFSDEDLSEIINTLDMYSTEAIQAAQSVVQKRNDLKTSLPTSPNNDMGEYWHDTDCVNDPVDFGKIPESAKKVEKSVWEVLENWGIFICIIIIIYLAFNGAGMAVLPVVLSLILLIKKKLLRKNEN